MNTRKGISKLLKAALLATTMLVSQPALAIQIYYNADGTTTSDLEAAAATWLALPAFKADPSLALLNDHYARAYGYTGKGVKLGLIDTSIYLAHPGFVGSNIIPLTTTGTYTLSGTFPGAVAGQSFTLDASDLSLNIYSGDIHGTVMSGFVVGSGNGGYPLGVASGATLYLARSIGQKFPTTLSGFDDGVFTAAYSALVSSGVRAINAEWQVGKSISDWAGVQELYSGKPDSGLLGAMQTTAEAGVLVLMPLGNYASMPGIGGALPLFRPQLEKSWISIAATIDGNTLAYYSNLCGEYTKWWCVTATANGNAASYTTSNGTVVASLFESQGGGGTSEASAQALAAVGVVMERYPTLGNSEIRTILLTTAKAMNGQTGVSNETGFGLIDLKTAMNGPGQLLGSFNASLPTGTVDTWSNNITEAALIQRKQEEAATLASLRGNAVSTYTAKMQTYVNEAQTVLDNFYNAIWSGNVTATNTALAAAKANPITSELLSSFIDTYSGYLSYVTISYFRALLVSKLPNYSASAPAGTPVALSTDQFTTISNAKISSYQTLVATQISTLSAKTDADYQGSFEKSGGGTLILTGSGSWSGGTTISGGILQLGDGGTSGSITGNVVNDAFLAFNRSNALSFAGVISGTGAVNQIGTGTTTLTGANTYTGMTNVKAGTLALASTGVITGLVNNAATFTNEGQVKGGLYNTGRTNANGGSINGGIVNTDSGTVQVNSAVTASGDFANMGQSQLTIASGSLTGMGTLYNTSGNASGISVAGGTTLSAKAIGNAAGSTIDNNGTLSSLTSALYNAGTLNNNAASSLISGGLTNAGRVNAKGGAINGAIRNTAGTFSVSGTVTSNSTFNNDSGATLAVETSGKYTLAGLLTNAGYVSVASGGTLIATASGISNTASGVIVNNGTIIDDLNNAGVLINNSVFDAIINNTGTFTNASGASVTGQFNNSGTLVNSGTLSSGLVNNQGTAVNNGTISGSTVLNGGELSGTGTVSDLTINGGVFTPGSSASGSTMTVNGNLTLKAGSAYQILINPSAASTATVNGTATLNGAVAQLGLAGNYITQRYTALTANTIKGTFSAVENSSLPNNFVGTASYDANRVYISLALDYGARNSLNSNQTKVGKTLTDYFNRTGGISSAYGGLTPSGLTAVSGESAISTQQTTLNAMTQFMGLMTDPLSSGAAVTSPDTMASLNGLPLYTASRKLGENAAKSDLGLLMAKGTKIWASGMGGTQVTTGNSSTGSTTSTSNISSFAVGVDVPVAPTVTAGFSFSGGGTSFAVANGGGNGTSDLLQLGAFLRKTMGPAYVNAAVAYGWQDVTSERTVTASGSDRLRSRFQVNSASSRMEAGYRFVNPMLGDVGVTPFAVAQIAAFGLPSYGESAAIGASTFALNYTGKNVISTRSELGVRLDKSFAIPDGIVKLRGSAAWAHEFNTDRSITASFQSLAGTSFLVEGASPARDSLLVSASAELTYPTGISLGASFGGEFSSTTSSYAAKGRIRFEW